jgi:hypothetical protein
LTALVVAHRLCPRSPLLHAQHNKKQRLLRREFGGNSKRDNLYDSDKPAPEGGAAAADGGGGGGQHRGPRRPNKQDYLTAADLSNADFEEYYKTQVCGWWSERGGQPGLGHRR